MNWGQIGKAWVALLETAGFSDVLHTAGTVVGTGRERPFHSQVVVDYWIGGASLDSVATRASLSSELHAVDHFYLRVTPAGVLERMGARMKVVKDIPIGLSEFDEHYVVRTSNVRLAKMILQPARMRALMETTASFELRIGLDSRLTLEVIGAADQVDWFRSVLGVFDMLEAASRDVLGSVAPIDLILAAENNDLLGIVRFLSHEDSKVVKLALECLRRLPAADVSLHLLAHLGWIRNRAVAAELELALAERGLGQLVDRFFAALAGDEEALTGLSPLEQDALAIAFRNVLWRSRLTRHLLTAGRAMVLMQRTDMLDDVERAADRLSGEDQARLHAEVDHLRALRQLPRSASADEQSRKSLPRGLTQQALSGILPRPVGEPD